MPANLENSSNAKQAGLWPQDWIRSVFIPILKKGNAKECSNHCIIALISHTSKLVLKILKPGFNSMSTENFHICKLGLEKAEEPEIKLPTFAGSQRKQGNSRKTSTSASFSSVQFSRSVMSDSLQPHESQHARPSCPSPSPGVHSVDADKMARNH